MKFGLIVLFIALLIYHIVDIFICWPFYFGKQKPDFVCMNFRDRLGNQMFQYAFAYSVAKEYQRDLIVPEESMLTEYFDIEPNTWFMYDFNRYSCRCFTLRLDSKHCGYDPNNVNITKNKNIAFEGYFQSWKYWKKYEKEVKQMFTFKPEISHNAQNQLKKVLKSKGITQGDGTVLVGVHIRYWEEYYNSIIGKNQAPKSYVTNAVNYFRRKFKKVLFIVATNSVSWARTMLNNGSDTIILEGNSAPVDMATLSLTNHTIMTVGSFGWLIGWLTGGITVYYKYPDEPGSKYAAQFHPGRVDHFYPGWIGME